LHKVYFCLIKEKQALACKKYYNKNKEKLNEKGRQRYLKNKDKILSHNRETCKLNPEKTLFIRIKSKCKRNETEFLIKETDIVIPEYCPLLNIKLDPWGIRDVLPSLDRIDNSKGYIPGNVWVISTLANRMKNSATKEQLMAFSQNVLKLMKED